MEFNAGESSTDEHYTWNITELYSFVGYGLGEIPDNLGHAADTTSALEIANSVETCLHLCEKALQYDVADGHTHGRQIDLASSGQTKHNNSSLAHRESMANKYREVLSNISADIRPDNKVDHFGRHRADEVAVRDGSSIHTWLEQIPGGLWHLRGLAPDQMVPGTQQMLDGRLARQFHSVENIET